MPASLPYILYSRKSTEEDERQSQSLENQTSLGNDLARKLGVSVIVLPEALSAKEPGRPVFNHILQLVDRGEVGGILTWHPDRLSRNEMDAAAITYRLRKGILKDLQFVNYFFQNSPEGIMMLQIALSQSQYSSSKLSGDVTRGIRNKLKKGWYPHLAPLGYVNDRHKDKGERTISKDPVLFPLIRRAWDLLLTGSYSVPHVLDIMNNEWGMRMPLHRSGRGGNPIPKTTGYRLFSNVFYAGFFIHDGTLYPGAHEPMVTLEEFDRVQKLIGRDNPLQLRSTRTLPYTGLIRCGKCGGQITASVIRKPSGKSYTYYHCQGKEGCDKRSIREDALEAQIDAALAEMEIPPHFSQWALEDLEQTVVQEQEAVETERTQRARVLQENVQKIDTLLDIRMRDLITDDEYKRKKSALVLEGEKLRIHLEEAGGAEESRRQSEKNALVFLANARKWLREGDVTRKRQVASNLGSNYVLEGGKLLLEPHPMLVSVRQSYKAFEAQYRQIELMKIGPQSQKNERLALARSVWSTRWDVNRTVFVRDCPDFPEVAPPASPLNWAAD